LHLPYGYRLTAWNASGASQALTLQAAGNILSDMVGLGRASHSDKGAAFVYSFKIRLRRYCGRAVKEWRIKYHQI